MNSNTGLWIDHREAIIVALTEVGEETTHIHSHAEKHFRPSAESGKSSLEPRQDPADDSREREFTGHLAHYYDEIIANLSDAQAILILGPGEAKGELKKRFEKHPIHSRSITLQTADKMTEPQVVALVRHHFHRDPIRQEASG